MRLTEGSEFADYTIVGVLGAGAMGEVYLAKHPRLPRQEALKVLPPAVSGDASYRERFIREADMAATLSHTNIVGVRDRGEYEGQLWISMEYVAGTNAGELLQQTFPSGMPAGEVIAIVSAMANALDYAHQQGLLHRDVKPANIILGTVENGTEQRIMLADFGIARRVDDTSRLTATNMSVGSIAYAAPEQLTGGQIDGRADQYALAATAYQLLTGTPLFGHTNPAVVIGRHLKDDPPRLGTIRPELAALEPVFVRALAKGPDDRFSDCREFAKALTQHADAAAATALAIPIPVNDKTPSRSRTAILVPVLLALVLAGSATFAAVQFVNAGNADHVGIKPQWQPYVDFGKSFTERYLTRDAQSIDRDLQRINDDSVGRFHDDFAKDVDNLKRDTIKGGTKTEATAKDAALKAFSENSESAEVIVGAITTHIDVADHHDDTRVWRVRLTVQKIGATFKVSELEFVK